MAPKDRKFIVQMYESEYRQIQGWVAKYQHRETGGDLFGLWAEDHTTVVQLVLGPGEHCRRSTVSFYQDVDYLERVGNILTTEEGLCHIGEWHSHHKLGLSRPSGGDDNTVWTNMDRYGINRFFLFIATIGSSSNDVNVGCFLFEINPKTERREPVLKGEIHLFGNEESPFRKSVKDHLAKGAESQNSSQSLQRFKRPNVIGADFVRDSTSKRMWHDYHEEDIHKKSKLQDTDKNEFHTTGIPNDQEMKEPNKFDHQEDKSEDMKDTDTEKSKLSQEVENQGNKLSCSPHVDQQPNLTEDDSKPETLQNQPSTPATSKENKYPNYSAIVTYIGGGFNNMKAQQEKQGVLHVRESNDGQATEESISKSITLDPVIHVNVKQVSEKSNTNQHQPSNALDENKNTTIEDASEKRPEDESKDAQQNDIKKSSATEEIKIEDETRNLLPVKDSDTEDEKNVTLVSRCFPKKKKKSRRGERKGREKRKEEKEKEEKKKKNKEKKENKKKEKKEIKEKEKKEKEEKKKENKEKKENKKKEKEENKEKKKKEKEEKKKKNKEKKENKNKEEKDKKAKKKGKKEHSTNKLITTSG